MDDADLGDNIQEHARQLEGEMGDHKFENDDGHLDPSRWWFASSAFPMLAGTLGPVASAFSICALVRPWRQQLPPNGNIGQAVFIPDPAWLLIINAIQLVVAIVSNIFLLLNMARRIRFSIAQPVTIIGWYISAMCLIALNATAAGPLDLQPKADYVWSQAFWYGLWAAILYFIVASLMLITFCGAYTGHYDMDFDLTPSQRTLMLQTILFLMYLLLGALVFSNVEGWTYLDAVYWADVTLFTVGFGDFSPQTNLGRGLLVPYAFVGVISLGLVIGSIRSMVLERGRRRLNARMVEKKRRRELRKMMRRGDDGILEPIRDENSTPPTSSDSNPSSGDLPKTEFERRREEFNLMRKIQHEAGVRRRWMALATSTGTWVVLWLVGAKIFAEAEMPYQQWDFFTGFYFTFVSLTTIGYGDPAPISNCGKSFFVFWSLLALPTMTVLISNAGDTIVKEVRDLTLLLGNITILPGEKGFKKEVKQILSSISCGVLFSNDENVEESPPGILGDAEPRDGTDNNTDNDEEESIEGNARNDASNPPQRVANSTVNSRFRQPNRRDTAVSVTDLPPLQRDPSTPLPTGAQYHYLLVCEIGHVTQHMRLTPTRHYSFAEWAWYLKLIGEDETSASMHRKARPHAHRHRAGQTENEETKEDGRGAAGEERWSWVGSRSPLMGSVGESEWILQRLTERLREELAASLEEEKMNEKEH